MRIYTRQTNRGKWTPILPTISIGEIRKYATNRLNYLQNRQAVSCGQPSTATRVSTPTPYFIPSTDECLKKRGQPRGHRMRRPTPIWLADRVCGAMPRARSRKSMNWERQVLVECVFIEISAGGESISFPHTKLSRQHQRRHLPDRLGLLHVNDTMRGWAADWMTCPTSTPVRQI